VTDVLADMSWDGQLIKLIRAAGRETFGTGRLRTRYHRCHEIAALAVEHAPEGTMLVQGPEHDRLHSWLELPDGRLWDPVTCEFGSLYPQAVVAKFTPSEVRHKLYTTKFYGWWA
jgi:hypothetical protein